MAGHRISSDSGPGSVPTVFLTARQAEVLNLVADGLATKQIARYLGISVRTVHDHLARIRRVTGAHREGEMIARAVTAGLMTPNPVSSASASYAQTGGTAPPRIRDGLWDSRLLSIPAARPSGVRIGYARISANGKDHRTQLHALAAAQCLEIVIERASTRASWPKLRTTLATMHSGDTLVVCKPDRVARSMREFLALFEDYLRARVIYLHVLTGVCAGLYSPDGTTIADEILFMAAAIGAEMERELIHERTLDELRTAQVQDRHGGRPVAISDDVLAVVRVWRDRGESVTAIARRLGVGRSTLYRALNQKRDVSSSAHKVCRQTT